MPIERIRGGDTPSPLAADLLKGVAAIAEYIGESDRRTFYLAEKQHIPAFKVGGLWHARKSVLDRHYGGEAA